MEQSHFGCRRKQICKILEWNHGKITATLSGYMLKCMPVHTMKAYGGGEFDV